MKKNRASQCRSLRNAVLSTLFATSAIGCTQSNGLAGEIGLTAGPDSATDTIELVSALVDPVKAALTSPTGVVDATSVPLAISGSRDAVGGHMGPLAILTGDPSFSPSTENDDCGEMLEAGTVDFGCLTDQAITGFLVLSVESDNDDYYLHFQWDDLCNTATGVCANGSTGALVTLHGTESGEQVDGNDFDIIDGEHTTRIVSGARISTHVGTEDELEYVVFVADSTFVMSTVVSDETGTFVIAGANGSFDCSYEDGGASGACTSTDGAELSW